MFSHLSFIIWSTSQVAWLHFTAAYLPSKVPSIHALRVQWRCPLNDAEHFVGKFHCSSAQSFITRKLSLFGMYSCLNLILYSRNQVAWWHFTAQFHTSSEREVAILLAAVWARSKNDVIVLCKIETRNGRSPFGTAEVLPITLHVTGNSLGVART